MVCCDDSVENLLQKKSGKSTGCYAGGKIRQIFSHAGSIFLFPAFFHRF